MSCSSAWPWRCTCTGMLAGSGLDEDVMATRMGLLQMSLPFGQFTALGIMAALLAAGESVGLGFLINPLLTGLLLGLSLPPGLSGDELEEHGEAFLDAAMLVSLTVESLGIMVHRGVVEFDMVWSLMGGLVLGAWDRVEGWAGQVRREQGREKFDEWIEWLVHQLNEHFDGNGQQPAHVRYADWKA